MERNDHGLVQRDGGGVYLEVCAGDVRVSLRLHMERNDHGLVHGYGIPVLEPRHAIELPGPTRMHVAGGCGYVQRYLAVVRRAHRLAVVRPSARLHLDRDHASGLHRNAVRLRILRHQLDGVRGPGLRVRGRHVHGKSYGVRESHVVDRLRLPAGLHLG